MQFLGIDWGTAKVGLAIGNGTLAEPLKIQSYKDIKILIKAIKLICDKEKIEKIIVGVSESQSAQKAREFGQNLGRELKIPVEFWDETLSTQDAMRLSRETGIHRKKRRNLEDAYAATVMLQSYLDSQ